MIFPKRYIKGIQRGETQASPPSGTQSLFYCKQPTTGSIYYPPGRALSLDYAATRPQPSLDSYSRTEAAV